MTKTYDDRIVPTPSLWSAPRIEAATANALRPLTPSAAALRRTVLAGGAAALALVAGAVAACGACVASPDAGLIALRWTGPFRRLCGLVKLGSGCCQAADPTLSIPFALYASSGVRPARVEWDLGAL